MMISYFHFPGIRSSRQSVFDDHGAHLLDLIRLRVPTRGLPIQDLLHAGLCEDAVAAAYPLVESQTPQQATEPVKRVAGIRCAAEYLGK